MTIMLKTFLHAALVGGAFSIAAAITVVGSPATAMADERYSDADSGYLRVASRIVQPVGIILDVVVFQPFTAWMSWTDPKIDSVEKRRHPRICTGPRPHAACSRRD